MHPLILILVILFAILEIAIIIHYFKMSENISEIRNNMLKSFVEVQDFRLQKMVLLLISIGEQEEAKKLVLQRIEALVKEFVEDSYTDVTQIRQYLMEEIGDTAKLVGIDFAND